MPATQPFPDQTVDVIIPVFNGQDYIGLALKSIERQTRPPDSIIIINDGSTDRTEEIVQAYQGSVPITYIKQPNQGPSAARNCGLKSSRATFVTFLDADDEWYPRKLEAQLEAFAHPSFSNLGCVYGDYHMIDIRGQRDNSPKHPKLDHVLRGQIFDQLLDHNGIMASDSVVMIPRACLDQVGWFDEKLRAAEDWDLWLRLSQRYSFDFVDEPLVRIRIHEKNAQKDEQRMIRNQFYFFNKWLTKLPASVPTPRRWAKIIISQVLLRLPKTDYWQLFNQLASPTAKIRLRVLIVRCLKWYALVRVLALPIIFIKNSIRPRSA